MMEPEGRTATVERDTVERMSETVTGWRKVFDAMRRDQRVVVDVEFSMKEGYVCVCGLAALAHARTLSLDLKCPFEHGTFEPKVIKPNPLFRGL